MKKLTIGEHLITSVMIGSGMLAMFCLLLYTFWHTGGLLSRYVVPMWLGYVCAGGVESNEN